MRRDVDLDERDLFDSSSDDVGMVDEMDLFGSFSDDIGQVNEMDVVDEMNLTVRAQAERTLYGTAWHPGTVRALHISPHLVNVLWDEDARSTPGINTDLVRRRRFRTGDVVEALHGDQSCSA